ncbi:GNAT family N-acetyltransferase [Sinorhizobium fredii]|uniref:GNAT family N-acetyltransferase n=1 Tax=Rhizobium fredii TaxID=380 RepID=UPI0006932C83|nr:GNAT family N-acetyltransferase [Sinorhizobium fredii]
MATKTFGADHAFPFKSPEGRAAKGGRNRGTKRQIFTTRLNRFISIMEVAVVNGCIVGVINRSNEFITALFVARSFRRFGIGSCLLHNAEMAGGRYLEVAAFNHRAISFYEARGWQRYQEFEEDVFGTRLKSFAMAK